MNRSCALLLAYLSFFLGVSSSSSFAIQKNNLFTTELSGELDILSQLGSRPTSQRGQLSFNVPSLKVGLDIDVDNNSSAFFLTQLANSRDVSSQKKQAELIKAYYQWDSSDREWVFRYGLIRNSLSEDSDVLWNLDLSPELRVLSHRFNYLAESDQGFEIHYIPFSEMEIILGVVDGEENQKDEEGLQKDFYVAVKLQIDNFYLGMYQLQGYYDELERPINPKERRGFRIFWGGDELQWGFEGLSTSDAAKGISLYHRADGWDDTAFPETIIRGTGGSSWLRVSFTEKLKGVIRGDYWDPSMEQKSDEIQSQMYFLYFEKNYTRFLIGYINTTYGENHSKQPLEKDFGFIAFRQVF